MSAVVCEKANRNPAELQACNSGACRAQNDTQAMLNELKLNSLAHQVLLDDLAQVQAHGAQS